MLRWEKVGTEINGKGEKTITYAPAGRDAGIRIESRNRAIPHASGVGVWFYTSYFVIRDGTDVREYRKLRDAQLVAERIISEEAAL